MNIVIDLSTVKGIVRALGGGTAVATDLKVLPSAVSNWNKTGVPKSRWTDLIELGERKGVLLTAAVLRAANDALAARVADTPLLQEETQAHATQA